MSQSIDQSINQWANQSISQSNYEPINQSMNYQNLSFVHISTTVQKAGKFDKEVFNNFKVYSLCILDFMIYNQLNEIYNLQLSTTHCTTLDKKIKEQ